MLSNISNPFRIEEKENEKMKERIQMLTEEVMYELFYHNRDSGRLSKYQYMIRELKNAAENINNKLRSHKQCSQSVVAKNDEDAEINKSKRNWQYKSRATNVIWYIAKRLAYGPSDDIIEDNNKKTNYYDFVMESGKNKTKLDYDQNMTEALIDSMHYICKTILYKYMECMMKIQKKNLNSGGAASACLTEDTTDDQGRLRVEEKLLLTILYELDLVEILEIFKRNLSSPESICFNEKTNKTFISNIAKHLHFLRFPSYIRGMHQSLFDIKLGNNKYQEVVNELLEMARDIKYVRFTEFKSSNPQHINNNNYQSDHFRCAGQDLYALEYNCHAAFTNIQDLIVEQELRKFNIVKRNTQYIHYYENKKKISLNVRIHENGIVLITFVDTQDKTEYVFDYINMYKKHLFMNKSWEERLQEYRMQFNYLGMNTISVQELKITTLQYNNFNTQAPHIYIKTTGFGLNTFFYKKNTNSKSVWESDSLENYAAVKDDASLLEADDDFDYFD